MSVLNYDRYSQVETWGGWLGKDALIRSLKLTRDIMREPHHSNLLSSGVNPSPAASSSSSSSP